MAATPSSTAPEQVRSGTRGADRAAVTHTLRLPQSVWARAGLPADVECTGSTVREVLDDACRRAPALGPYLVPGERTLPASVRVFVDDRSERDLAVALGPGATVRLVVPSAGG